METHLHVVAGGGRSPSIESDHEAWHRTGDPCLLCDDRSWHGCPLTSAHLSDWGRDPLYGAARHCYGAGGR